MYDLHLVGGVTGFHITVIVTNVFVSEELKLFSEKDKSERSDFYSSDYSLGREA